MRQPSALQLWVGPDVKNLSLLFFRFIVNMSWNCLIFLVLYCLLILSLSQLKGYNSLWLVFCVLHFCFSFFVPFKNSKSFRLEGIVRGLVSSFCFPFFFMVWLHSSKMCICCSFLFCLHEQCLDLALKRAAVSI